MSNTAVAEVQEQDQTLVPVETAAAVTPLEMLNRAVSEGKSVETLTKLMELHERWEANQARKAFSAAMADAKAEIPVILKNRHVGFDSKKPGAARTDYKHEDLAEIARTVDPILAKHGLSYRYRVTSAVNEPVTVTCIISHRDGHSEETTLQAGRDESGNKNSIQAVGSTITFLQRYTLKAGLGLAAAEDNDGASASGTGDPISDDQFKMICRKIEDSGADEAMFLEYFDIEKIEDLPANRYDQAYRLLTQKAAKKS